MLMMIGQRHQSSILIAQSLPRDENKAQFHEKRQGCPCLFLIIIPTRKIQRNALFLSFLENALILRGVRRNLRFYINFRPQYAGR